MQDAVLLTPRRPSLSRPVLVLVALIGLCGAFGSLAYAGSGVGMRVGSAGLVAAGWLLVAETRRLATVAVVHRLGDAAKGGRAAVLAAGIGLASVLVAGVGVQPGPAVGRQDATRLRGSLLGLVPMAVSAAWAALLVVGFRMTENGLAGLPLRGALAYLLLMHVSALVLGVLPVPGLDGYALLEPWLPGTAQDRGTRLRLLGPALVAGAVWLSPGYDAYLDRLLHWLNGWGVAPMFVDFGMSLVRFLY